MILGWMFLGPAIWINCFCKFWIVSTIDLFGPGQHWYYINHMYFQTGPCQQVPAEGAWVSGKKASLTILKIWFGHGKTVFNWHSFNIISTYEQIKKSRSLSSFFFYILTSTKHCNFWCNHWNRNIVTNTSLNEDPIKTSGEPLRNRSLFGTRHT